MPDSDLGGAATASWGAMCSLEPRRVGGRTTMLQTGLVLAGLAILTWIIGARDLTQGGFSWSDAPLHAMDGVFVHDFLTQGPTDSLRDWAQQYYLKYQCLGLVVYYPPAFAVVEAVVFLVAGISVAAARVTVLLFTIGTVWLIYLLARELFCTRAGVAAAILAIATPAGVSWSRQVMLEWPATFFVVLTLLAWRHYRSRAGWCSGVGIAFGCVGAYLTKQTAVFVLGVLIADALVSRQLRIIARRSFLVPMGVALLIVGSYSIATAGMNTLAPQLVFGSPPLRHLLDSHQWTWYVQRLPSIIGWPALVGWVVGIIGLCAIRDRRPRLSLPLLWLVVWWLVCTVLAANEERYFFYAVPAMTVIVAAGLSQLDGKRHAGIGSAALAGLCCVQVIAALVTPTHRLPTMCPTVNYLARQPDADLVLLDAVRDGQFIFDVRTTPAAHDRIIAMRASKFLYSRSARTRYNYKAHIRTPNELLAWLDQYGVRYVVVEDRLPETQDVSWDVPPRMMLREMLRDAKLFDRVFSQSLDGDDCAWRDVQLVTYRYRQAKARQSDTVSISIPAMGKSVTITLPPKSAGE